MFFVAYDFCSLKLFKFKTEGQTMKQKISRKSHKTEIKILTNPGFALLGFENPAQKVKQMSLSKKDKKDNVHNIWLM